MFTCCEKNYRRNSSIVWPLKGQSICLHCFFARLHFAKYKNKVKESGFASIAVAF